MIKKFLQKPIVISISQGLLVGFLVSLFSLGNLFSFLQHLFTDLLYIGHPVREDISIVAIDNESLQSLGRWPWDRSIIAKVLDEINENGASVIGVDIAFPESQNTEEDEQLKAVIEKHNNIILPMEGTLYLKQKSDNLLTIQNTLFPIQSLSDAAAGIGFVNMPTDQDGIVRRQPLVVKDQSGIPYESFATKILRKYLNVSDKPVYTLLKPNYFLLSSTKIPIDSLSRTYVNYAGPPGTFQTISASEVLNKRIPENIFKNKIVLIGATAPNLHDEHLVPISKGNPMPGVEIHANIIQTYLDKRFLFSPNKEYTLWLLFIISLLLSVLLGQKDMRKTSAITGTFILLTLLFSFILFGIGVLFETFYFLLAIILVYITNLSYKYLYANKQKALIKKVFQYYVATPIVDEILKSPDEISLGGEKRNVTLLFSDIRGFTSISEKMDAEELVQYLNDYLDVMTNIIIEHNGVVDKFIGDAIMAFWNAPIDIKNHEKTATKASLKMIKELKKFNKKWEEKGYPQVKIGIGLNTGEVISGNIGSSQRFDYTIIGDNVNLGSRVEGLNKAYGTEILITESTHLKIKNTFQNRFIDLVTVKGKDKPVKLYQIITDKNFTKEWIDLFETSVSLYQQQQFKKAKLNFQKIVQKFPKDQPSLIFIERCNEFIKSPPEANWNGVYKFTKK